MSIVLGRITPAQVFKALQFNIEPGLSRSFSSSATLAKRHPSIPVITLPRQPQADLFQRSKPLTEYLGPDFRETTFRQGKIDNCYLHSTVDATQHHPLGKALLASIRVESLPVHPGGTSPAYRIYFPSGHFVELKKAEIGVPKDGYTPVKAPKAFQMLELAYAKLVSRERNQNPEFASTPFPNDGKDDALALVGCGLPSEAMGKLFVGRGAARFTRGHPDPEKLALIVKRLGQDRKNDYLLCAITQEEGMGGRVFKLPPRPDGTERNIKEFQPFHSYSIRRIHADGTVTVADPYDTENKVERLTLKEFGSIFTCVDGIKFRRR